MNKDSEIFSHCVYTVAHVTDGGKHIRATIYSTLLYISVDEWVIAVLLHIQGRKWEFLRCDSFNLFYTFIYKERNDAVELSLCIACEGTLKVTHSDLDICLVWLYLPREGPWLSLGELYSPNSTNMLWFIDKYYTYWGSLILYSVLVSIWYEK